MIWGGLAGLGGAVGYRGRQIWELSGTNQEKGGVAGIGTDRSPLTKLAQRSHLRGQKA